MRIPHIARLNGSIMTTLVVMSFSGPLHADVFLLKSGGQVEGELIAEPVSGVVRYYVVKLSSGGTVTLARAQDERIARKSEAEVQYEKILASLVDDADSHWQLAEWCRSHGLREQRSAHLEHVIRHDPGHVDARHGLGYSQVNGRCFAGSWRNIHLWQIAAGNFDAVFQ